MDWQLAIIRNRDALLVIIVALMKSLGLDNGGVLTTLPQFLFVRALRVLRPAESALRRLIFIAAHALSLRGFTLQKPRRSLPNFALFNPSLANAPRAFNLIDPLKTYYPETPDLCSFSKIHVVKSNIVDRTPVPAAALGRRLLALKTALENIPGQAKRLARWNAMRDFALRQNQPHRLSPMRPGLPFGHKKRNLSAVETVLRECHGLAVDLRARVNST